jgi:hypothetical protein
MFKIIHFYFTLFFFNISISLFHISIFHYEKKLNAIKKLQYSPFFTNDLDELKIVQIIIREIRK